MKKIQIECFFHLDFQWKIPGFEMWLLFGGQMYWKTEVFNV